MNKVLVDLKLIGSRTRPIVVKRKDNTKSSKEFNLQLALDIPQDSIRENKYKE